MRNDSSLQLDVLENTRQITLHVKDLNVDTSNIRIQDIGEPSNELNVLQTSNDTSNDFFVIDLDNDLIKGREYLLDITYYAALNEGMIGFYRSSYFDKKANKTAYVIDALFLNSHF